MSILRLFLKFITRYFGQSQNNEHFSTNINKQFESFALEIFCNKKIRVFFSNILNIFISHFAIINHNPEIHMYILSIELNFPNCLFL